jgi:hypothetical protein
MNGTIHAADLVAKEATKFLVMSFVCCLDLKCIVPPTCGSDEMSNFNMRGKLLLNQTLKQEAVSNSGRKVLP